MTSELATKLRYQALGLVLLLIIAAFVTITVAAYKKVFTPVVHVTLETDHIGNQLDPGADVKVRGLIVGEVRTISSDGSGARLDLALQPDTVHLIPANVTAQLLPKTLFGERYVALDIPANPSTARLSTGDVIGQDRSSTSIEIEKVLSDVMPLLQAVQPEKLASTLDAMSTALSGRGAQLGQTLVQLNTLLTQLNPSLPNLDTDIQEFASVANTYNQAAPRLLDALNELTTTSKTIVDEQSNLQSMYATLTTSSVDLTDFLTVNKNNIIGLATTSTPTLNVLARYAPEYDCLLHNIVAQIPNADKAFGKGTDHPDANQVTIVVAANRGKYQPGVDTPQYNDDRGPRCYSNDVPPARAPQYPADGPVNDGSTHPPPPNGTWDGNIQDLMSGSPTTEVPTSPSSYTSVPQVANSPAEEQLIATLVAPSMGEMPSAVPNWASVLVGPLFRGTEVNLK
jgi:virulence factor Mce-like protein